VRRADYALPSKIEAELEHEVARLLRRGEREKANALFERACSRGLGRRFPAGLRRDLGGGGVAPAAPSFDRSDLGLVCGLDPALPYLAADGANRVFYQNARWAYDLAGAPAAYTFEQWTGTAQPLYEAAGLLGKPCLYYTTDDFLSTTDGVLAGILDGTQVCTVYAAVDRDSATGSTNCIWSLGDSGASQNSMLHRAQVTTGADFYLRAATLTGSNNSAGSQTDGGAPARYTFSYGGTSVDTWVGSVASIVAHPNAHTPACDRLYLGAQRFNGAIASFMAGRIGLLLFYAKLHDAAQRAFVWGLLQSFYPGLA
jgi:hypothetical protein